MHIPEYLYMIYYIMCTYLNVYIWYIISYVTIYTYVSSYQYTFIVLYHGHDRCYGRCVTICQFSFLLQGLRLMVHTRTRTQILALFKRADSSEGEGKTVEEIAGEEQQTGYKL